MMKEIIPPVERQLLLTELNHDTFVRKTNNGNNEIYIISNKNAPNVLREIGRTRELTFRAARGGTGKEIDLDEFDLNNQPYQQLIVWNPTDLEIVGGYRYIFGRDAIDENGKINLATTELFHFSTTFISDFLPFTIELGRSYVQPKYQPSLENRKGLFSLDNLWDGLGALIVDNPEMQYFYGKVTMYSDYNERARDLLLGFMKHYFPDQLQLVWPIHPIEIKHDISSFLDQIKSLDYKEGYKVLNQQIRSLGENIPPLVNSYMNLSPTMKTFGTAINGHFGQVEETGILVRINDIYPQKKERHINSYLKH